MKKEDYMKLPKETLARELERRDETYGLDLRGIPIVNPIDIPCWAPGGYCSNPQMDCINCPRPHSNDSFVTVTKLNTGDM